MANSPGPGSAEDAAQRRAPDRPALPYAKAFVVQFTTETDACLEHATGRVEHLQSGRRAQFASVTDLLACIARLLAGNQSESERRGEPTAGRGRGSGRKIESGAGAEPPSP